jgi:hypothetical protein
VRERKRELWRERESGELFVVELEGGRVASAHGPLAPEDARDIDLALAQIAHARTAAFDETAERLERERDRFEPATPTSEEGSR